MPLTRLRERLRIVHIDSQHRDFQLQHVIRNDGDGPVDAYIILVNKFLPDLQIIDERGESLSFRPTWDIQDEVVDVVEFKHTVLEGAVVEGMADDTIRLLWIVFNRPLDPGRTTTVTLRFIDDRPPAANIGLLKRPWHAIDEEKSSNSVERHVEVFAPVNSVIHVRKKDAERVRFGNQSKNLDDQRLSDRYMHCKVSDEMPAVRFWYQIHPSFQDRLLIRASYGVFTLLPLLLLAGQLYDGNLLGRLSTFVDVAIAVGFAGTLAIMGGLVHGTHTNRSWYLLPLLLYAALLVAKALDLATNSGS